MKKVFGILFVALLFFAPSLSYGRSAAIYVGQGNLPEGITRAEVIQAIIDAGTRRGWVMSKVSDKLVEGKLLLRGHAVVVSIPLTASSFAIEHKTSSPSLWFDGKRIHPKYNEWVMKLEKDIKARLIMGR